MESSIPEDKKGYIPPRENHTIRHKGEKDKQELILNSSKTATKIGKDTYSIPFTILDDPKYKIEYSSPGQRCYSLYGYNDDTQIIGAETYLDQHKLWKKVVEILKENCVSKKKRKSNDDPNYPDRYEVEYRLPIIGHKITRYKKLKHDFKYLYFQNKKYHTNVMYTSSGVKSTNFYKYGNFKFNKSLNRLSCHLKIRYSAGYRHNAGICIINPRKNYWGYWYNNYSLNTKKNMYEYAEIDLGENTEITHIGTMGMRHNIHEFPDYEEQKEYGLSSKPKIQVVSETDKKWVTSYQVFVRVDSGKKWIGLGKFNGNTDRLTEVVHRFNHNVYARYVRVIPKTYNNYPGLQISLFGPKVDKNNNVENENESTVSYTITYPSKRRYKLAGDNYDCYYWSTGRFLEKLKRNNDAKLRNYVKKFNIDKNTKLSLNI